MLFSKCDTIYLIEEWLYFKQYNFHKSKIAFHRASMKFYEAHIQSKNIKVVYIKSIEILSDIRKLIPFLKSNGVNEFEYVDTNDYWLEKRIKETCASQNVIPNKNETILFLNDTEYIYSYFKDKKRMFQIDFYKHQRLSRNILNDTQKKTNYGKWTFVR